MIKIEQAFNGWILKYEVDGECEHVYVFDEGNTEETTAKAFMAMLYKVKDVCGPHESRYSAHRVMINIEPGDKHNSHPDNQES